MLIAFFAAFAVFFFMWAIGFFLTRPWRKTYKLHKETLHGERRE